jgi:hypothetical protein
MFLLSNAVLISAFLVLNHREDAEHWIRKTLEWIGRDVIEVLSRCLPGGTEGSEEQDSRCPLLHSSRTPPEYSQGMQQLLLELIH